jgi:hypothetical protein
MHQTTLRDLKAIYEQIAREAPDDPGLPGIRTMIQHMEAAGEPDDTVVYVAVPPGVGEGGN